MPEKKILRYILRENGILYRTYTFILLIEKKKLLTYKKMFMVRSIMNISIL
jgi:hypothetical protein